MSFLNPYFLWAIPLALIPLILHLVHRRPHKKMLFSYTKWVKEAHQKLMPRKKLRDLFLLLLRTLMIFLLVLFFARPLITRQGLFPKKGDQKTVIILFDVSASMGAVINGRPVLELAKGKALALLRRIGGTTRIGVIVFSDRVHNEISPSIDHAKVATEIRNLSIFPHPTNILPALELGSKMLAHQSSDQKSMLVLSDLAENGWDAVLKKGEPWRDYDPEVRIILWEVVKPFLNAGIGSARLKLNEEGYVKGLWNINNPSGNNLDMTWRLTLNDRVVNQGRIQQVTDRKEEIPFMAKLPEGGYFSGRLSMPQDALTFDDNFYIAGRVAKGFQLLIVDGESGLAPSDSESYYLKLALEYPRDPRLKSLHVVRLEDLRESHLNDMDVVVLANVSTLGDKRDEVYKWIEKGGGLLMAAGEQWSRQHWDPLNIVNINGVSSVASALMQPEEISFLTNMSTFDEFEWNEIEVYKHITLKSKTVFAVMLTLQTGEPILGMKRIGRGNVIIWLTTIDRAWSNFPTKPVYAPLMREIIAGLADPRQQNKSLMGEVGDRLQIQLPEGIRSASVITPDGSSSGARISGAGVLVWDSTNEPGLYKIKTDKSVSDFYFAVNIKDQLEEGDLTRISKDEIKHLIPHSPLQIIRYHARAQRAVLAVLQGRDLTNLLIVFLIIIFLIETILGAVAIASQT